MITEFILPMRFLAQLESEGIRLSVRDGKLYGAKGKMTEQQREIVKANKESLIAIITNQCPDAQCNAPLRVVETETFKSLECPVDASHFGELMNKMNGDFTFQQSNGVKPPNCTLCGGENDGNFRYCNKCWLRAIDGEDAA